MSKAHGFNESKGHRFKIINRQESYALNEAQNIASRLCLFINATHFYLNSQRTLSIQDKAYQAITMKFVNHRCHSFQVEISIPLDFNGETRIWTSNRINKRVWSTINLIEKSNCNRDALFNFLSHNFDNISDEFYDDIPF